MFSRALAEPQPDWPLNTRITGHISYDGSGRDGLSPDLERFLSSGPAPVVFTLGTSVVADSDRAAKGIAKQFAVFFAEQGWTR